MDVGSAILSSCDVDMESALQPESAGVTGRLEDISVPATGIS